MRPTLRRALTRPFEVLRVLHLLRAVSISPVSAAWYLLRILCDRGWWRHLESDIRRARQLCPENLGGWLDFSLASLLYALVRCRKPEVVVETGVGPGASSAFILKALRDSGAGHLYSIDLPGNDALVYPQIGRAYDIHVPDGFDTGWLVRPDLRSRWTLLIGDTNEKLPLLLERVGRVDIFLHDSLHTDAHVNFELSTVLPHMKNTGLLLADDVHSGWSTEFVRFCARNDLPYVVVRNRLGCAAMRGCETRDPIRADRT